jgi:hypothetical protein
LNNKGMGVWMRIDAILGHVWLDLSFPANIAAAATGKSLVQLDLFRME